MSANKYKKGEFGYWWTVTLGRKDIDGTDYAGGIDASSECLTSLRGAPCSVGYDFWCNDNELTSLKYCPEIVPGEFWCHPNALTSLEHAPTNIGMGFWCNNNELTNLAHSLYKVGGVFACANNPIEYPIAEIIDNDIIAKSYLITDADRVTFEELEAEKQRRANIKRQLGPFAITPPGGKI